MENWDDLRYCLALYRSGTMTGAAKMLGANVGTVSRRIQRMTEEMGQTLFVKEGAVWVATRLGTDLALLAQATEDMIQHTAPTDPSYASGSLVRISCAVQIMQCGLFQSLPEFLAENPDIRMRVLVREQSLALNESDIRVGFDEPKEGRLVRRRLGEMPMVACCAKAHRDALEDWIEVIYSDEHPEASFGLHGHLGLQPRMELEGLNILHGILLQTKAAAVVPLAFLKLHDDLVKAPIDITFAPLPVWISFHDSRRLDPLVRVAEQFIESAVKAI
ncbi:MAG: LysR family transcriptional regulator [Pseudomonadota bacterium]